MKIEHRVACVVVCLLLGFCDRCDDAQAAELQMRARCQCTAAVVRLGDVVDIYGADSEEAERLATLELFPAPALGRPRFIGVRELQDLLALRGVSLAQHTLSGPSRVEIVAHEAAKESAESGGTLDPNARRRVIERVEAAIEQALAKDVASNQPWQVTASLDEAQAARLAELRGTLVARRVGDARSKAAALQPGDVLGDSEWELRPATVGTSITNGKPANAGERVIANVSLAAAVVVARRGLPRGAILREGDVELRRQPEIAVRGEPIQRLEEVLGMETSHAVTEGQTLTPSDFRAPTLVRRGDAVTVYAKASGVRVRTTGRAKEDGSLGGLVAVETLQTRQTFLARVSGPHEVEVAAMAVSASNEAGP